MPLVKNIEKRIFNIEGFEVNILYNGKNVRGDASLPTQYYAERMTRNSFSVSDFREKFQNQYPGYSIEVLRADGKKVSGQTKLSTVRDTYLND